MVIRVPRSAGRLDHASSQPEAQDIEPLSASQVLAVLGPLVQHSADAVLVADANGHYLFANLAALAMLRIEQGELLALKIDDVVLHDSRWTPEEIDRYQRDGEWAGSLRLRAQDGSVVPVEARAVVIPGPAGPLHTSILHKRAGLQSDEETKARLAAIVESSEDAIVSLSLEGIIADWNAAAERLFGFSAAQVVGRSFEVLLPAGVFNELPELLERVARGERLAQYDARRQTLDGRELNVSLAISPIRDLRGAVIGAAVIARDVTDLRRVQAERDRLYAELEAEFQRAAAIQAGLLPRLPPDVSGYEFAGLCLPARYAGGDFFDWASTNDGVRLSLGDVMGKGMSASLMMATARAALRAAAHLPVAAAVETVNSALFGDLIESNSFITLFHANLETASGLLTYVDAGHGMAFVQRRDGSIEVLRQRNLPLGLEPDIGYRPGSTVVEPGDTVVIYSDGLPDSRPELDLNSATVATQLRDATEAQEKLERLVKLADEVESRPDDLTLVVVRRMDDPGARSA